MGTLEIGLGRGRFDFLKSSVMRGMLRLAVGSSVARLITLASIPVLTRIYSPEDYGVLAVFSSLITIMMPVLTFRYVIALPLPRTAGLAMNLLAMSFLLLFVLSAVSAVVLYAFGPALLAALSMEKLAPWWWLIALSLFGAGGYEILSMWAARHRDYRIIARTQIFQALAGELLKIGLGLAGLKPLGLLVGQFVSYSMGIGSFIRRFGAELGASARAVSWRRMRFLARYYSDYPLYRMPAHLLMVGAGQMPLLFAAAFYDAGTAGQLGLAMMSIALPSLLVAENMSKAFYAEASKAGRKRPREIEELLVKSLLQIAAISVVPSVLIYLLAPWLFPYLFGHRWDAAGVYSSILALYLVPQMLSTTAIKAFNIYGSQSLFFFVYLLRAAGSAAVFAAAYFWRLDIEPTLYLYVAQFVLINVYTVHKSLRIVREAGAAGT